MTDAIIASRKHPEYWKFYADALVLVSNRYSKMALVQLTAHLLIRAALAGKGEA